MSRKSRPTQSSIRGRDVRIIANAPYRIQPALPLGLPPLSPIEDRRVFHPQGVRRPAKSFLGNSHTLRAPEPSPAMLSKPRPYITPGVAFEDPNKVLVCVRRKRRREVLHAFNKTGKTGQKKPRQSYYSSVKC